MYWRGKSFDRVEYQKDRRDQRSEWNYRSEIFAFSRRLQENLSEDTLIRLFTHPSYLDRLQSQQKQINLPEVKMESNAEFAHRGKILLDEIIKPYLRYNFDRLPEDGIESITNYLCSEPVASDIAKWIGCKDLVLTSEWPPASTTMADTVYALVAAIESDLGLDRARRFIVDIVITYLNDKDVLDDVWNIPNPREALNLVLANSQLPSYEPRIMFQTGINTIESCHIVGLYTNQKFLGSSAGETLPIAEECAALDALQRMFDLTDNRRPLIYGPASETIDYSSYTKKHDYIKTWRLSGK